MRNGTENQIEVWLYRHGMTQSNERHRYLGQREEPLLQKGIEELEKQITPAVHLVAVSPLLRCKQSADILFSGKKQMEIAEWKEIDFGDFEGKNYQELKENPDYQRWIDSWGMLSFPNGESRQAFVRRCMIGLKRVLEMAKSEQAKTDEKKYVVAAVVHGGTVMALLSSLTGREYFDFQLKNGESATLLFQGEELIAWEMNRS